MVEPEILVDVGQLTRRFAACEALGGVSFQLRRGEVAGLLGPNGSGKTTTLRLLSGILTPTSGRVRVAGWDVVAQWMEARQRIGFLPENVPLYPEMRVDEYLKFRAQLRGLGGARRASRLRDVIERCGLGEVVRRRVGVLSRGFRQRVGLADCLLHEPDVLLLDEPLAGMDAEQVEALLGLLADAGRRCAVLMSTHVLAEAERICQRVLILNQGRLAAANSPTRLMQTHGAGSLSEVYLRLTRAPRRVKNPVAKPGGEGA